MDNRFYNVLRYAVSFLALIFCCWNPLLMAGVAVVLLLLNNFLDDVVFYVGNKYAKVKTSKKGVVSPVNGVVTMIERNVPLFSNIEKVNPVTHNHVMSVCLSCGFVDNKDRNKTYNHVAVFLNKLNHHVVMNPAFCNEIVNHFTHTENKEMVEEGELVGHNGEYLTNDAQVLRYGKMYIVVTLDKYVSRTILGWPQALSPRMIICKGSQCDMFIPTNRGLEVEVGDILQIGDQVASAYSFEQEMKTSLFSEDVASLIKEALASCNGVSGLFTTNLCKTFRTFKNPVISVSCAVGLVSYFLSPAISYVAFSSIILFVAVRWYRHLMYCLMNYFGLKHWMEKSYSVISKISIIWERKAKKSR